MNLDRIYIGDCLEVMRSWPDSLIQTCVTSPPYWGLRDYGDPGQIGLEETPEIYIKKLVEVFREVRRVLCDDGTLWLNLGDSYYNYRPGSNDDSRPQGFDPKRLDPRDLPTCPSKRKNRILGLKEKDLVGIPWRIAFALQTDGWYLRSDIIWAKPNPMPESVTDRPTKAHEYIFLMAKQERYFYDSTAIKEKCFTDPFSTSHQTFGAAGGKVANTPGQKHKQSGKKWGSQNKINQDRNDNGNHPSGGWPIQDRNKRSVWSVATSPFTGAHFATFPTELIKPCILAGSRPGNIVLDPFMGAGTTALVAAQYNRRFLGIELNAKYAAMAEKRIRAELAQIKMPL